MNLLSKTNNLTPSNPFRVPPGLSAYPLCPPAPCDPASPLPSGRGRLLCVAGCSGAGGAAGPVSRRDLRAGRHVLPQLQPASGRLSVDGAAATGRAERRPAAAPRQGGLRGGRQVLPVTTGGCGCTARHNRLVGCASRHNRLVGCASRHNRCLRCASRHNRWV